MIRVLANPLVALYRGIFDAVESNWLIAPLVLLGLFSIGVFWNIHLPGIYIDAVNPDYLAAKIIAGSQYINHFPPWDAFPVLGNWYHGVMHTYFGLIFFKIFGFSIFSLRIAHAVFGVGILLISHMILSKATMSRLFSMTIIGILALDPAFIFAFRTQNYITLSPLFFLLASFYLLLLIRDNNDAHPSRVGRLAVASGVLAGWSFYGYFIYIFFTPAFVVIITHISRKFNFSALKITLFWLTGFALGAFLYFYGYAGLLVEYKGVSEVAKHASGVNITGKEVELFDRAYLSILNAISPLLGDSQYRVIFSQASTSIHGAIKLIALVSLTLISLLVLVVRKRFNVFLGYLFVLIISFYVVSLYFAARLAPHHMIPLLPLLYLAFGVALHQAGQLLLSDVTVSIFTKKIALTAFTTMALFLGVLNLQHQGIFQKRLVETGGVGYFSDSQTLLAEEAIHNPKPAYYVFGEWGFFGSFSFLTAGKIPFNSSLDDWAISRVPCDRDLVFVFWGLTNPLVESFAIKHGRESSRRVFYQRDGAVSLSALTVTDRRVCLSSDNRLVY